MTSIVRRFFRTAGRCELRVLVDEKTQDLGLRITGTRLRNDYLTSSTILRTHLTKRTQYEGELQGPPVGVRIHAKDPACSRAIIGCTKVAKRLKTSGKRCVFKDQEMKKTGFVEGSGDERKLLSWTISGHRKQGKEDGASYLARSMVALMRTTRRSGRSAMMLLRSPSSKSVLRWRSWTSSTTMTCNGASKLLYRVPTCIRR
jgi:hypothetical protein